MTDHNERITLGMTTLQVAKALSDGYPGALAHDKETMADLRLCHRGAHFASLKRQTAGG